jgi:uncharacterized damage-inducible protein DinB
MSDALRFPIGEFDYAKPLTPQERASAIIAVRDLPKEIRSAVAGLSDAQLNTPYRDGGWTVRQIAHHLSDASVMFYTRLKSAMTDNNPIAFGYDENDWMKLPDNALPIEPSLQIFDGLHARWANILENMSTVDFQRTYNHSERGPETLDWQLAYAGWHCRHHVAQITSLRKRMNW